VAVGEQPSVAVAARELHEVIRECFEALGIQAEDSTAVADALLYANLRGIDSHGFERVPIYMRRVRAGLSGGTEHVTVVREHRAVCRLDAAHALGPAAAVKAIDRAIELAREHGIGLVVVGNATNFGAAGFYALRAALGGMLAVVATNAPKLMAPYGAAEPFLGSNALAIGAPIPSHDEFLLDMSSTVSARGKVRRAGALGEPLDGGLAFDVDGKPTTDPAAALAGSMVPFGGPKGSGLAFAITVFLAVLAGADVDDEVASIYSDFDRPQNLGQLFLVIDPSRIGDVDRVDERLHGFVERLHALKPYQGFRDVRYAGEGGAARARARLAAGIPLSTGDLEAVASACRECGVADVAERVRRLARRKADH
jgi:LDH2 family malate/lactate/ureidoglycolate dehydrogenase